jgi:thioesterase domain-containing protein
LPNAFSSIVSIKASGQKNPVFCFHGVGGNVLNYMALVPACGANRPLVGLQSRGMDGVQPMTDSIEEMAKFYINEMKAVQAHGPYFLAGGSMGGTIALEVAQQLILQGETIEKLVMFDTFGPNINIQVYDKSERSFWQNLKISFFYRRKAFTNKIKVKILNLLNQKIPLEIRLFNLEMNNYQALWKYRPQIYSGDLHIIRAKMKSSGWYSDPLMGWSGTITGKIETYEIEGNHNDFIESPELCKVFAKLL